MLLKKIAENNILIESVWMYEPKSDEQFYLSWLADIKRTYREIEFTDKNNIRRKGFCLKNSSLFEPFALWVSKIFGDGIYWLKENENFYFLIIVHGTPVSGSDIVVTARYWGHLRERIKEDARYQFLNIIELDDEKVDIVINECVTHQSYLKKRRRVVIACIALGGCVVLMLCLVMLKIFIKG